MVRGDLTDSAVSGMLEEAGQVGVVARIDGVSARTPASFFTRLAEALSFPSYFGNNWEATKDCLTDLNWLPAVLYVLVVEKADQLLFESESDRAKFLRVAELSGEEWARPVDAGEWWDRPPRPFHVLLDLQASEWPRELLDSVRDLSLA